MKFDIFVRTCDKNLTLGSVVPLAMFILYTIIVYIHMENPAFLSFDLGSTLLAADVNLSSKKEIRSGQSSGFVHLRNFSALSSHKNFSQQNAE